MISALVRGYEILHAPRYRQAAEDTARFILQSVKKGDELFHVYAGGSARVPGFLEDYSYLANALVDVYEMTGDEMWVWEADQLVKSILVKFRDAEHGGFFMTSDQHQNLLVRSKSFFDEPLPSGTSMVLRSLIRLSRLLVSEAYWREADVLLQRAEMEVARAPHMAAHVVVASEDFHDPEWQVVIVGSRDSTDTKALAEVVGESYLPNRSLAWLDPQAGPSTRAIALSAGKSQVEGKATAYVCFRGVCREPITDPQALARILRNRAKQAAA